MWCHQGCIYLIWRPLRTGWFYFNCVQICKPLELKDGMLSLTWQYITITIWRGFGLHVKFAESERNWADLQKKLACFHWGTEPQCRDPHQCRTLCQWLSGSQTCHRSIPHGHVVGTEQSLDQDQCWPGLQSEGHQDFCCHSAHLGCKSKVTFFNHISSTVAFRDCKWL